MKKAAAFALGILLCFLVGCSIVADHGVTFTVTVVDARGKQTTTQVTTTKSTVGDALVEKGILTGDNKIAITTVNGQTLDYATDGMYWAFHIGKDESRTNIYETPVQAGATYYLLAKNA